MSFRVYKQPQYHSFRVYVQSYTSRRARPPVRYMYVYLPSCKTPAALSRLERSRGRTRTPMRTPTVNRHSTKAPARYWRLLYRHHIYHHKPSMHAWGGHPYQVCFTKQHGGSVSRKGSCSGGSGGAMNRPGHVRGHVWWSLTTHRRGR